MSSTPWKPPKVVVDKDRFDAILRKIAVSNPLPVKDLTGTFPKLNSQKRKDRD